MIYLYVNMESLWVLGYGPLLVDSQFVVDYRRLRMLFDGHPMPPDTREGVRLLYDTVGRQYYVYTKYMNQTLGNYGYMIIRQIYSYPHMIANMPSIRIHGFSNKKCIQCTFQCDGYNNDLQKENTYLVTVTLDLRSYIYTVSCRVYK